MPRKLPWARAEEEPSLPTIKTENPPGRNLKRKSPSSPSTPSRPKRVAHPQSAISNRTRSPSTSPPPEPPKEQQSLVASDDRYRIVEDEFLHNAQKFTAHLHRAEYQRLKALTASRNAETIRAIGRPVVGKPNRVAKRSAEVARKEAKQRALTEPNDIKILPTGLRGLMESPRKETRSIRTVGKATTATRAAAGFRSQASPSRRTERLSLSRATPSKIPSSDSQSRAASPSRQGRETTTKRPTPHSEEDSSSDIDTTDDDEDLGSIPLKQSQQVSARLGTQTNSFRATTSAHSASKTIPRAKSAPDLKQRSRPAPGATKTETIKTKGDDDEEEEDDDDDDPFGIKAMRIRRAKSRDQLRKPAAKETVDSIPNFL